MNDTSALLGQLKIDRGGIQNEPSGGKRWVLWLGLLAIVVAGLLFWLLSGSGKLAVQTTTVRALPAGGGVQASVLDASGYVVARRRATVSSKITGKVVEVLVEEGMAVKAGDVLARIDDINAVAQEKLAEAQLSAARAQLGEVRVQQAEALRQLERTRELAGRKLVSVQALDTA
ncbi:MAG: biotin/lipoyl-binding protein, partial [Pseudomonadota bacterium]|nr:biotin/lipoyl-binding protein [Pseudomonadota bacterium]